MKDRIAPCGLDCSICVAALKFTPACPGCNGPDAGKPEHCRTKCQIRLCDELQRQTSGYCYTCHRYPCDLIQKMERKYQHDYPLKESLIENLAVIREKGEDYFIRTEKAKWTCPRCGALICIHTGKCSGCDKRYGGMSEK